MKKIKKNILCSIVLAGSITCGITGIASLSNATANAATAPSFEMIGGSVRLNEPTGLRFAAELDAASFDADATYGMLIFPVNVMEKNGIDYENYNAQTDYIAMIETQAADYFTYMENLGKEVVYTVTATPVAVYDEEEPTPTVAVSTISARPF